MSNTTSPTITLAGRFADRDSWTATGCPIDATISLVGARPMMLLLREAFYGAHCFKDFVARAGFTEAVTAARLKELLHAGILELRPYQEPGQRRRNAYYLTEKGLDLFPVLVALAQWGERWAQEEPAISLVHNSCGATLVADVRCARGHRVSVQESELFGRKPNTPKGPTAAPRSLQTEAEG
jgi:DNA-binding HxlR family transcriptional regulator